MTGEHARRQRAGARAISSADVLELLLGLPIAAPVPVASADLPRTRGVGSGSARCGLGMLRRGNPVAVAPVAVELALVAAVNWRAGLEWRARFAPFCARAVVLLPPSGRPG